MCFSATASFTAGAVLTATGVLTLKKISAPEQRAFAVIPFLFGVQQFAEGFVWLGLTHPEWTEWQRPAAFLFLTFAQVVWPVWVPFSIMKLEQKTSRRKVLLGFTGLGLLVSSYLAYCLFVYPVETDVVGYHIHYTLLFPLALMPFSGIVYFIPTVISPFVSSIKRMPILGIVIWASYLFTKFYYREHVISIWCFIAAIFSVLVYAILVARQREQRQLRLTL
jgi:hypothetical protein